ncbi:MAG: hypothetical protein H8E98_01825 [Bacteroidetes bacterium]|nr:hypothetical protein [Bacteroidota bacterium]
MWGDILKIVGAAVAAIAGALISYVVYETVKAQKIEDKLHDNYKKYKKSSQNKFKASAKRTLSSVEKMIKESKDLTSAEKKELKEILKRHSEWVYA